MRLEYRFEAVLTLNMLLFHTLKNMNEENQYDERKKAKMKKKETNEPKWISN